MLTGAQLLSVMQPQDSVTLSHLASTFKNFYYKISTIWDVWNWNQKCYWRYFAFYKDKEETLQTYNRKVLYVVLQLNVVIISSTLSMLLEQKQSCSGLKKYIIPSSKDQFQY